jgi:hypothetical protein
VTGIYSDINFLKNNNVSSSFEEPVINTNSTVISIPGIRFNEENYYWEFTHGLPNTWNKLNVVQNISEFPPLPIGLNEGIYVDRFGQTKYNINEQQWLNLSIEVTDEITRKSESNSK